MYKRLPVPPSKQPRSSFLPVGHRPLPEPSTKPAEPPVLPPILHDMLPKFQAKLTVGQPNDQYEQEADQVAEQVMRMPEPKIQRVCPECEKELQRQEEEDEEERLQTKPLAQQITPLIQRQTEPMEDEEEEDILQTKTTSNQTPTVSSSLQNRITGLQGGGQPLPHSERAFFEPRFGHDFSQVRVHRDSQAAETARAVNARAFTLGRDIVFGAGQYQPSASEGRCLLAHELTHVVQQKSALNSITNSTEIMQRDDITQISITPQYARGLSEEDLNEQIMILTEQTLETFPLPGDEYQPELEDQDQVAQSNLSILQAEQRRRRAEQRERRIRQTDWGSFRRASEVDVAITPDDRMLYVMERLVQQYGYSVEGAAGIVGNLWEESRIIPNIVQGMRLAQRGEPVPRRGGIGLVQWTDTRTVRRRSDFLAERQRLLEERQLVLQEFEGVPDEPEPLCEEGELESELRFDILFNMDAQIDYVVRELQGGSYSRSVNDVIRDTDDINLATRVVYRNYERPQPVVDWIRAGRRSGSQEERRMNHEEGERRKAAIRARELYSREHPESESTEEPLPSDAIIMPPG